ncbi:polyprenyl synthetase family protein [Nocardia sp. NPDC048505]|uniref:polyprenyl synthetase family protein n=1 Tax=Nocardia sp. NPDC048505 TaxID=3155756 RepID=UPI0033CA750D
MATGPDPFARARRLIDPGLRASADRMRSALRRVIGYHFGWWDEHGNPADEPSGKALRPVLAMLAAEAVGGTAERATNAALAVELAHNFSLLHDDIMDGDRLRRHRPTAWAVFGVPAAILAGDALSTLATEALAADGAPLATDGVRRLDEALLRLDDGQAADLSFERRADVPLAECLTMAADKTGALFAAACELGAMSAGASPHRVWQLRQFGEHLGLVFQLVDDLHGIWGDPAVTGKAAMSDLRARKKTLPVVAALGAGNAAAARLAELYCGEGPLDDDAVRTCADLIERAGARAWAHQEVARALDSALACLHAANPEPAAAAHLTALARQLSVGPTAATVSASAVSPGGSQSARLNPHLNATRAHATAWARDMSLFTSWSERQFEREDYALLSCAMFPSAPAAEIATITDWNTWLFYVDDHFAGTYEPGVPIRTQVARLARFMPLDPSQGSPLPTTPFERGLADLWSRTAPGMPRDWRRRTREHVERCLAGNLEELAHRHVGNPIEYLELKRATNGAPCVSGLIEYARGLALPEAVAHAPTLRALLDSVNDASILTNDLHSYEREIATAPEPANMIAVLRNSLGCDPDQAVTMTRDLARSRRDRFEQLAAIDIPAMITEYALSPADTANVLAYVEALRDWEPGWQEWFAHTARYGPPPASHPEPVAPPGPVVAASIPESVARLVPPGSVVAASIPESVGRLVPPGSVVAASIPAQFVPPGPVVAASIPESVARSVSPGSAMAASIPEPAARLVPPGSVLPVPTPESLAHTAIPEPVASAAAPVLRRLAGPTGLGTGMARRLLGP